MQRRLTLGLAFLRATGVAALVLLLWNPLTTRPASGAAPFVLLDASLSMAGYRGRWRQAVESARAIARGGPIWRFGTSLRPFDSLPPDQGATNLAPGLVAAAARGGPVAVVTDGAIDDLDAIAPDLLRAPRVALVARAPFRDFFVAGVSGPAHLAATDTLRLTVSCGAAGPRGPALRATLAARVAGRRILAQSVALPESGVVAVPMVLPASLLPTGWSALEIRLEGVRDSEPRDDARLFVVEVSAAPAIVVIAAPPTWDARFVARTLAATSGGPVRMLVGTRSGASEHWLDGTTLASLDPAAIGSAVTKAQLVVLAGESALLPSPAVTASVLRLVPVGGPGEDWYVDAPPASPLASALAGVAWDSLPPLVAVSSAPESGTVVLSARLARRGAGRAVVVLSERGGGRRAVVAGAGLYRWAFRGGASAEAYRALVAALADWLLAARTPATARATPAAFEVANGLPLSWRWSGAEGPHDLLVRFRAGVDERTDTLRFDAGGRAALSLPPGVYSYALEGGPERGLVAVDEASTEWQPRVPGLRAQPGRATARSETVSARDRGVLFGLVIAAFAAEWAWRRRAGLP